MENQDIEKKNENIEEAAKVAEDATKEAKEAAKVTEGAEKVAEGAEKVTEGAEKVAAEADKSLAITNKAIELLKTVFDPEIPVNVYDLGLIYKIDFDPSDEMLHVDMTLTAPNCPAADFILEDVRQKLVSIEGTKGVDLRLVFEPVWDQDMMSEEAKLELGFL